MSLTVLLACYRGARYLPALIDSLSAQTLRDLTVLYQDDGSDDETPALLQAQSQKDPRFHSGTENGRHFGAKGNFFSLMAQDTGDYTALCDQDDIWLPKRLQDGMNALREAEIRFGKSTPLLVHGDATVVDEQCREIHPSFFRHQGWDVQATDLKKLLVQNNATGCTMLFNQPLRELVVRYGHPEAIFMHDWFIAQTAAAFGHVIILDKPLIQYRQHTGNEVGASSASLPARAVRALGKARKGRERILLTYRQAQALKDAYGDLLPEASARILDNYLKTRRYPWPRRVLAVQTQGYTMQSPVTRAGQILFG